MDLLPVELIQIIADYLNFYDKLYFKMTNKFYYKNILIDIPIIVIEEYPYHDKSIMSYFGKITNIKKLLNCMLSDSHYYIYILVENKGIGATRYYDLELRNKKKIWYCGLEYEIDFDIKIFVQRCYDIMNQKYNEPDLF